MKSLENKTVFIAQATQKYNYFTTTSYENVEQSVNFDYKHFLELYKEAWILNPKYSNQELNIFIKRLGF
jgi:hypothetical protein